MPFRSSSATSSLEKSPMLPKMLARLSAQELSSSTIGPLIAYLPGSVREKPKPAPGSSIRVRLMSASSPAGISSRILKLERREWRWPPFPRKYSSSERSPLRFAKRAIFMPRSEKPLECHPSLSWSICVPFGFSRTGRGQHRGGRGYDRDAVRDAVRDLRPDEIAQLRLRGDMPHAQAGDFPLRQ